MNNEIYGISAEVAIAKAFCVEISDEYLLRSDPVVVDNLIPFVYDAFEKYDIPFPYKHVAEGNSPYDFLLSEYDENGELLTLSVKTGFGNDTQTRIAPQRIGQCTDSTWYDYFEDYASEYVSRSEYDRLDYLERSDIFKQCVMDNVADVLTEYFHHIFECSYLMVFYNVAYDKGAYPDIEAFGKYSNPRWYNDEFTFSQSLDTWNESNTVYYKGQSIGEFQVHTGRNCFKFRFNAANLFALIDNQLVTCL